MSTVSHAQLQKFLDEQPRGCASKLAKKLGITPGSVSLWKQCARTIPQKHMQGIRAFMDAAPPPPPQPDPQPEPPPIMETETETDTETEDSDTSTESSEEEEPPPPPPVITKPLLQGAHVSTPPPRAMKKTNAPPLPQLEPEPQPEPQPEPRPVPQPALELPIGPELKPAPDRALL